MTENAAALKALVEKFETLRTTTPESQEIFRKNLQDLSWLLRTILMQDFLQALDNTSFWANFLECMEFAKSKYHKGFHLKVDNHQIQIYRLKDQVFSRSFFSPLEIAEQLLKQEASPFQKSLMEIFLIDPQTFADLNFALTMYEYQILHEFN